MRDVVRRADRHARPDRRDRRLDPGRGVACSAFDRGGFIMFPMAAVELGADGFEVDVASGIRAEERAVFDREEVR